MFQMYNYKERKCVHFDLFGLLCKQSELNAICRNVTLFTDSLQPN